jgi:Spy/CpxP family protein refolding chaperone
MKTTISRLSRTAAALVIAGIVSPFILAAADNPTPTPAPAAPAGGPPAGGGGGRGGGGFGGGGGGGNFQGRGGMGGMGGMGAINLDDQQRQLLREAMQKNREELAKLDEKLRAAQKELVQVTIAENFDEKVVREKAEAVSKIQTEMILLRCQAFSTLAPSLKPEQRDELVNGRMGGMVLTTSIMDFGGGRGGGPGGGQPGDPNAGGRGFRNAGQGGGNNGVQGIPGGQRRNRQNPNP